MVIQISEISISGHQAASFLFAGCSVMIFFKAPGASSLLLFSLLLTPRSFTAPFRVGNKREGGERSTLEEIVNAVTGKLIK